MRMLGIERNWRAKAEFDWHANSEAAKIKR
jgi:hypothetical protein